ncbi:aryl-sulfate sulfotransferase [Tenacibaculum tangerinum]|uniref:Aryl-sulfate sulfotransferase n=1 Tax=Tenacibaculum tangerinum TaxID=3038772 RepID=A0ABY8L146_9FLAO|nr:aryl-sulfate sulfotransferase [Tenacibaculum tangerinum]WGH75191.1 aryl-sulfate sulfotransferase [Tenacibaculum tangerinum]
MKKLTVLFYLLISLYSCTKDETPTEEEVSVTDEIKVYQKNKLNDDLVLITQANTNEASIIRKDGSVFHKWNFSHNTGNDIHLEDNGKLLALLKTDNDFINFGGYGGQIQIINPDSSIEWKFEYSTNEYNLHHDIEMLPNGNIIALLWERKTLEMAVENGYNGDDDIFIESVIEINPITDEIVWKWSSWNHIIQEHDNTKKNFGAISKNPQRININHNNFSHGDIMHANAIEYDAKNDLIFISVNFYNEVWVIDHSTSTEEAASSTGGNYNKGGDLVYRFGNPSAFESTNQRLFHNNHHCNIIEDGLPGAGNLLIFNNGNNDKQSVVYELEIPATFDFKTNPTVVWSYTDPSLHSAKVSGAKRTKNGNTIITEGDFGYWEVTKNKELVWQYVKGGFYWRGYPYEYDSDAIKNLTK